MEKGMPIIVLKDDKTKLVMAKVVPSKGVQEYAVEVVRKFVEQLMTRLSLRATTSRRSLRKRRR